MHAKRSAVVTLAAAAVLLALPLKASAWPTWGNIDHPDCAFAAAANWELLHGGTAATEDGILREFYDAGGTNEEGVTGEQLERYWATHGIGGRKAVAFGVPKDELRHLFRRYGALIVELAATPGERWGAVTDEPGGIHFAVVRYITRRGPVLLTWGELGQMTWWQWREDALLVYAPHPASN